MRVVLIAVLLASCVPSNISRMAGDRLGVHGKRLQLTDYDRSLGYDIYTFCRAERGWLRRTYDGACVTLVCPVGDDGTGCR